MANFLEKDVSILPLDDSFDKEKAKDYAQKHMQFYLEIRDLHIIFASK